MKSHDEEVWEIRKRRGEISQLLILLSGEKKTNKTNQHSRVLPYFCKAYSMSYPVRCPLSEVTHSGPFSCGHRGVRRFSQDALQTARELPWCVLGS